MKFQLKGYRLSLFQSQPALDVEANYDNATCYHDKVPCGDLPRAPAGKGRFRYFRGLLGDLQI